MDLYYGPLSCITKDFKTGEDKYLEIFEEFNDNDEHVGYYVIIDGAKVNVEWVSYTEEPYLHYYNVFMINDNGSRIHIGVLGKVTEQTLEDVMEYFEEVGDCYEE